MRHFHLCNVAPKRKIGPSRHELWKTFFANPFEWWDNRFNKANLELPDFVHKATKQALWFDPWLDPSWVGEQLSALEENGLRPSGALWRLKSMCDEGKLDEALHTVGLLEQADYRVSTTIFYRLIQECTNKEDLASGEVLLHLIVKCGFQRDHFLGNHLVRMFVSFGSLREAYLMFNELAHPDPFVWSTIISAHSKLGEAERGIDLYCQMLQTGLLPDGHVFGAGLKVCTCAINLTFGRLIHGHIIESGMESELVIANALIDLYVKCASLEDGHGVFDQLRARDVISWGALIAGYSLHGHFGVALKLLNIMQVEGIEPNVVTINAVIAGLIHHGQSHVAFQLCLQMRSEPDKFTFVSLLKACTCIQMVKEVHAHTIEAGNEVDVLVGNTLVDMYAKHGALSDANTVFKSLKIQNLVSWNALIAGYARSGYTHEAECLLQKMEQEGIELDNGACNSLIASYALNGHNDKAFKLFEQMGRLRMSPDRVTFLSILKAWSAFVRPESVCLIHSLIVEWEFHMDIAIANTLIDVYGKCGSIDDARSVFDMLKTGCTVVTWNAMIVGYAQHSLGEEALDLFASMYSVGMQPDKFTFTGVLKAAASILALECGKLVHDQVTKIGLQDDAFVWSSLVDMYVKCGSAEDAHEIISKTVGQDTVTWNALISGHAQQNGYDLALQCLERMQQGEYGLDDVTYVGLLSACSHSGLAEESCSQFKAMTDDHAIAPTFDHYNCLVDSLGRAGRVNEANDLLESIPFQENMPGWTALLGHCRLHGKVEFGKKCHEIASLLDRPVMSCG